MGDPVPCPDCGHGDCDYYEARRRRVAVRDEIKRLKDVEFSLGHRELQEQSDCRARKRAATHHHHRAL